MLVARSILIHNSLKVSKQDNSISVVYIIHFARWLMAELWDFVQCVAAIFESDLADLFHKILPVI